MSIFQMYRDAEARVDRLAREAREQMQREDKMDIKVGDTVHVKMTVMSYTEGDVLVVSENGNGWFARREDIVHVEPRPLQVGDLVTWGNGVWEYTIRAVAEGHAMLSHEIEANRDLVWRVEPLSKLRRVGA